MRNIIDELWYGNICPVEHSGRDTAEVVELVELINTNRERLCESLTEAQVERLRRYDDCIDELENITAREAFAVGFRLGLRLAAEAFCGE